MTNILVMRKKQLKFAVQIATCAIVNYQLY